MDLIYSPSETDYYDVDARVEVTYLKSALDADLASWHIAQYSRQHEGAEFTIPVLLETVSKGDKVFNTCHPCPNSDSWNSPHISMK